MWSSDTGFWLSYRLLEILEFAEDMEIDIPKIWTYLGELVGQMIQDGSVPLSFLKQASKPLVASNKAGIFVAEVLHDACHREVIRYNYRNCPKFFDTK